MVRERVEAVSVELSWMFGEVRGDHVSDWAAMAKAAELLGSGASETRPKWLRQGEIDKVPQSGTTSKESAEVRGLKRENAILKAASASSRPISTGPGCGTSRSVQGSRTRPGQ